MSPVRATGSTADSVSPRTHIYLINTIMTKVIGSAITKGWAFANGC